MTDDIELEKLKAKRLAEMQKNLSLRKDEKTISEKNIPEKNNKSPRESLVNLLGFRGLEVLENAEVQFPTETKLIIEKLGELIISGEINESFDGGQLLSLFRSVGLNIRMNTKINVEQDGKFVSLGEKLRSS